jgi:hypothetical protein
MVLPVQARTLKKSINDLSNMVFGVALSLGSLTLINNISSATAPAAILSSIVTFAFSFVIIIYIWFRYTKALELMNVETRIEMDLKYPASFLGCSRTIPFLSSTCKLHSVAQSGFNFVRIGHSRAAASLVCFL